MKNWFIIGFGLGILYFLGTYVYELLHTACPWTLMEGSCGLFTISMSLPSSYVAVHFWNLLNLKNFYLLMFTIVVLDGVIGGLILMLIKFIVLKVQVLRNQSDEYYPNDRE